MFHEEMEKIRESRKMELTRAESVRISIRKCICKLWPLLFLAIVSETAIMMDATFVPQLLKGNLSS